LATTATTKYTFTYTSSSSYDLTNLVLVVEYWLHVTTAGTGSTATIKLTTVSADSSVKVPLTDTVPPTYSNVGTNTTLAGQPCQFSVLWNDDMNVSMAFISHNNTGTWQYNITVTLVWINSTAVWANYTLTLNTTVGMVVGWYQISNDTSNNWNTSMPIQTLTITGGEYSQSFTETINPTATLNQWQEQFRSLTESILFSGQIVYGAEWKVTLSESVISSGTLDYQQEQVYIYPQTVTPSAELLKWMDMFYTFPESISQIASMQASAETGFIFTQTFYSTESMQYWQEHSHNFQQTVNPVESLSDWQEQLHIFPETILCTVTLSYSVEGGVTYEVSFSFTETPSPTGTMQYWIEGISIFIATVSPTESVIYYQEQYYPFQEFAVPSETVKYWQEHGYSIQQTVQPSTTLQSSGEGIFIQIQTISPTETVTYLQEQHRYNTESIFPSETHSIAGEGEHSTIEAVNPASTLGYGGEGLSIFVQTISPTESITYWQEQQYILTETPILSATLQYAIEGLQVFYETFTETVNPSSILNYWIEMSHAFSELVNPSVTSSYWQEHGYNFLETTAPSSTLSYWMEILHEFTETIITTSNWEGWLTSPLGITPIIPIPNIPSGSFPTSFNFPFFVSYLSSITPQVVGYLVYGVVPQGISISVGNTNDYEMPANVSYSLDNELRWNETVTLSPHEQKDYNFTEMIPIGRNVLNILPGTEHKIVTSVTYTNPFTKGEYEKTETLLVNIPSYYLYLRWLTFSMAILFILFACYLGYRRLTTEEYESEVDIEGL
jgi:hypothetical protein